MMAGIVIDNKVVCREHDFNGMNLDYFWSFLLNEYIPAFRNELSNDEIDQIHQGIKDKKDHIFIGTSEHCKKRFTHSFVFENPMITFGWQPQHDFDGF